MPRLLRPSPTNVLLVSQASAAATFSTVGVPAVVSMPPVDSGSGTAVDPPATITT